MRKLIYFILFFVVIVGISAYAAPTFADLAVMLAKGYFKENVSPDASVEECAAFLNKHGVCFSMFDLMDPNVRVTTEDFARVVGQSKLLFFGEAEFEGGCVKRPIETASWVDCCLLNDVSFKTSWVGFLKRTEGESLLEVRQFFGGTP